MARSLRRAGFKLAMYSNVCHRPVTELRECSCYANYLGEMMKVERGVMAMKDGKAWGKTYEDGRFTYYGWMEPEDAPIHNPKFCKKPTDVTWEGSHYVDELKTGELVEVERVTEVKILGA